MGRFCGDFRRYRSALSVSGNICGLSGDLGGRSLHPKIPFPADWLRQAWAVWELGVLGGFRAQTDVFEPGPYLSRVQSEGFELLAPFCRSIAKSLDPNAARQTTFDRSAHEIRCKKRK
jgi:hypothetical protein